MNATTKTQTESQDFILSFEDVQKPVFTLRMSAEIARPNIFKTGFELSEHDGISCCDLFPAVAHLFPKGASTESNKRNNAWVNHWDDETLAEMGGKSFMIRISHEWITGDTGEKAELLSETLELIN